MERYVAIDNVCAWPNLTLLPTGEVIAHVFNQPCHGKWVGDVECWCSGDEGRTWQRRGVPAPHEPGTNRMNVAAGVAGNGDLIVLASGWSNRPEKGAPQIGFDQAHILPCWVCRSVDSGQSWTRSERIALPHGADTVIPFGKIISLSADVLGVSVYCHHTTGGKRLNESWLLRSRDDGLSWGEPVLIGPAHNETDLLHLDSGLALAAARSQADGRLDLFVSEDEGGTWSFATALTGACEHPAHLLRLSNGDVLLTYGIRHRGFFGLGARYGENSGRDWSTPTVLVSFDDAFDGGYPSSVELKDGSILTAYYASSVAAHTRYHMGVVRWNIQERTARNTARH